MCEHRAFQLLPLACISSPQRSNPMHNRVRLAPTLHCSPQTFILQLNNLTVSIVFTLAATLQCTHSQTLTALPGLAARQGWSWARSLLDADDSCWKGACETGPRVFSQLNIGLIFQWCGPHAPTAWILTPSQVHSLFVVFIMAWIYSHLSARRFRVKQPPPSTGLKVTYKPGPVSPTCCLLCVSVCFYMNADMFPVKSFSPFHLNHVEV